MGDWSMKVKTDADHAAHDLSAADSEPAALPRGEAAQRSVLTTAVMHALTDAMTGREFNIKMSGNYGEGDKTPDFVKLEITEVREK